MKILYFEQGKEPAVKNIENDLAVEQQLVGGYIEVYPVNEEILIICDKEGWCKGRKVNRVVEDEEGIIHQAIRGNFFVCANGGEDFKSLTDSQVQKIMRNLRPGRYPEWIR